MIIAVSLKTSITVIAGFDMAKRAVRPCLADGDALVIVGNFTARFSVVQVAGEEAQTASTTPFLE